MAKLKITSPAGMLGLLFLIAGVVGAVFQFIYFYLKAFQFTFYGDPWDLIFFIISIAAMAFLGLLFLISLFGSPKALWIIFAFLGLACVIVPPIIVVIQTGTFVYIEMGWYTLIPMDFIGFWLAAGGSLLALIFGIFTPSKY